MITPRIKICGLKTPEALYAAVDARADFAGFVFFPPSPRHINLRDAKALSELAEGRIGRVGLFVDADDEAFAAAIAAANLDAIQLHGKETPARTAQVKARFGLPVWKALPVRSAGDVERAEAYCEAADLILFDAKTPDGALPGGMGLTFDWNLVLGWKHRSGWGLAGGLTPDTVAGGIQQTAAPLVDTSSGVESAPGVKDVDKIAAFCEAARSI